MASHHTVTVWRRQAERAEEEAALVKPCKRSISEIVLGNEQLVSARMGRTEHYRQSEGESERIGIKTSHLRLASSLGAIS